jgi:uncharacterized protein
VRAFAFLLFSMMLFSGCAGLGSDKPSSPPVAVTPVPLDGVVADGAVKEALGSAVRLTYAGELRGTMQRQFTIPAEAVLMRAQFQVEGEGERSFSILESSTRQSRCFDTSPLEFAARRAPASQCTGVTVLDTDLQHTASYSISMTATRPQNSADVQGQAAPPSKYTLLVDLLPGPLDGPASKIDLSAIAPVQYGLAKQRTDYVRSSIDGIRLFVEINLPDGPGPWPTILISTPYNQPTRDAGGLTQGGRVRDFVPRGYALVSADVRGYANSEGCVEVWGPKEQQDQYDLVEWVAKQPWSNGRVAMYGQSYVGTTPHEAAIKQAPHLTTIATVAGLTDPYFDWHYGGVPNGESTGSPAGYSLTTDAPPKAPTNPMFIPDWFLLARQQGCDLAPMLAEANDPNAVHGPFYDVRNFSAKAKDIKVPVLYTQGYIDTNVKATQALNFFNDIQTPKLGIFGPWLHRHPPRGDFDLLLHAWMDHWMMDRPTGILGLPTAQAITNADTIRYDDEWPPSAPSTTTYYLDSTKNALSVAKAPAGKVDYACGPVSPPVGAQPCGIRFTSAPLEHDLYVAGEAKLRFTAKLEGAYNVNFAARLVDVAPDGKSVEVRFGMLNGGLRNGYEKFEPVPTGQDVAYTMTFLPTEHLVKAGHKLVLAVGPATTAQGATPPGRVTWSFGGAADTRLELPTLAASDAMAAPTSVLGFPAFQLG